MRHPIHVKVNHIIKHKLFSLPLSKFANWKKYFDEKDGIEIGGPSEIFAKRHLLLVYEFAHTIDKSNFAVETSWQNSNFRFSPINFEGRNVICEGTELNQDMVERRYDFFLSSHVLEHIANPLKALKNWETVIHDHGRMIVVLPNPRFTFDHKRSVTAIEHLRNDYDKNIGEGDLTHLSEIFEKHDLSLDPGAGAVEKFYERSKKNIENRCLHHHVFNHDNAKALFLLANLEVEDYVEAYPFHLIFLLKKNAGVKK